MENTDEEKRNEEKLRTQWNKSTHTNCMCKLLAVYAFHSQTNTDDQIIAWNEQSQN